MSAGRGRRGSSAFPSLAGIPLIVLYYVKEELYFDLPIQVVVVYCISAGSVRMDSQCRVPVAPRTAPAAHTNKL
jgi:hypothetical protein